MLSDSFTFPGSFCYGHRAVLVYRESRFLLVFDEPEGLPGRFEPPLVCDDGGCQW